MNKDVIYIEPEDDITDIIAKIENAKEHIVALVPPKNPAVLRSIVNIKLIMKAASAYDKTVVLVTTDSPIIKLAAVAHIPVTKNLQSAPAIPTIHDEEMNTKSTDEVVETAEGEVEITPADAPNETSDDKALPDTTKPTKPAKEPTKTKNTKIGAFFAKYKRWCLLGAIAVVAFVLFLVWALVIAPAVDIIVTVRTTSNNFSENITFTTNINEEDAASGKFYLAEKKLETPIKIEFKATGTKNLGEKATGKINVYTYFKEANTVKIPQGSTFTNDNLSFNSTTDVTLAWDFNGNEACQNRFEASLVTDGCKLVAEIPVIAAESGTASNLPAKTSGWTTNARGFYIASSESFTGGTDKIVTVIQQSDIDEAKKSIVSDSESEAKAKLLESMGDGALAIESSFKQTAGEITSSPKLGEEITDGVTPAIETTIVASIFTIDKAKVEEFISSKVRLPEDQKIYQLGNPFIENFLSADNGYAGKLKTSYASGPKVTEEDIMNKSKGKKIGEVQSLLKSINGVSTVSIEKSFFWVNSVPDDPNKITINLSLGE